MKVRTVILVVLLAATCGGCGGFRDRWPWGRRDVPVTPPTEVDANAERSLAPPPAPAPPPHPRARPEMPAQPVAAAPQPSAAPLDRPMDLLDLLREPRPAAAPSPRPPAPPATVAVVPVPPPPSEVPVELPEAPPVPAPAPPGPARELGPPEVVAASMVQVNQRFITVEDVLIRLRPKLVKLPKDLNEETFRHRVGPWIAEEVQNQVTQALVLAEAEKRLTDDQKKQVEAEVQEQYKEMLADAGGSKSILREKLEAEGSSLDEALKLIRESTTFRRYLQSRFMPAIAVSRSMLWNYYTTHLSEFTTDKKVQMQIVAAPFKAFLAEAGGKPSALEIQAARTKARELIDQALAALRAGEDFGEVARKHSRGLKASEGGVWPLMGAGSFLETKVEETAFQLQAGQVAGPIETDTGFYVVKAMQVQAGRTVPFEDAQEEATEKLRMDQYRKLTDEYLGGLLKGATIGQSDSFLQIAVNQAVVRYWHP